MGDGLAWPSPGRWRGRRAQPGGLSKRLPGIKSSITGAVSSVTESRELDQATTSFNGWYKQQGRYPDYTQSQLDERSNDSWGAGMDVSWCTPRDVVLTSLTASGTVSRLLIDGKKVGDAGPGRVPGRPREPASLDPLRAAGRARRVRGARARSSPHASDARSSTPFAISAAASAPTASIASTAAGSRDNSSYRSRTGRRYSTTASATVLLSAP